MTKPDNDAMNDLIRDAVKRRQKRVRFFDDDQSRKRRSKRQRGKESDHDRATHRPSRQE
jgi:hypothetical protein